MCQTQSQFSLCLMQLLHLAGTLLFVSWLLDYSNTYESYESQCGSSADISGAQYGTCPTGNSNYWWSSDEDSTDACSCIEIFTNSTDSLQSGQSICKIPFDDSKCIGTDYICECEYSFPAYYSHPVLMQILTYSILVKIALFELIKILIAWRLRCLISSMRANPQAYHDPECVQCAIQTLGNSVWLRCVMCDRTGKSLVLYMYHRGRLMKNCGCCCIWFWQSLLGGAFLFFLGYAFTIGLYYTTKLGSEMLFWITLVVEGLYLFLQFTYCCCSTSYTYDDEVKNEVAKYHLPFVDDVARGIPMKALSPQALPLSVQPPPQPQMLYVQPPPQPQIVYVQQMPEVYPQQPQTVMVIPQPVPSVAGSEYSAYSGRTDNVDYRAPGGGGINYQQVVNPSAPDDDDPVASAPPPAYNYDAPPPAYHDDGDDNGDGNEGGATHY
eukprot:CAMPEP_0197023470 /NCGR_PEP_ID=MMETSP1384-20130603/4155_1 /TAXON_ID=29189 /ORGANISM="Ammonia sp." /LENGTH=437 /DNA_ID=CAMNT_0042451683 /DNA_START=9 /DNA_END=1322 /DNA_ORIENTATION=-